MKLFMHLLLQKMLITKKHHLTRKACPKPAILLDFGCFCLAIWFSYAFLQLYPSIITTLLVVALESAWFHKTKMLLICFLKIHGVWKSQRKYHSSLRAKQATFTFWVDKSWLKMPKMVHFCKFLKTWSLRSSSVTRQVSFNMTKIGGKCQT